MNSTFLLIESDFLSFLELQETAASKFSEMQNKMAKVLKSLAFSVF